MPTLIPAEEVPVVDAVVSPASKPKRVVADEDEESARPSKKAQRDDDDENEPRKKKKRPHSASDDDDYPRGRRRKGGGRGTVVAAVVVGGLLLLAGLGLGIILLAKKGETLVKKGETLAENGESLANKTPPPAGWKQFTYSNDGFKAYFPNEPQVESVTPGAGGFGGRGRGRDRFAGNDLRDIELVSTYTSRVPGELLLEVEIIRFRNDVPRSVRDEIPRLQTAPFGGVEARKLRWLGSDAAEVVMGEMTHRMTCTRRLVVTAMVKGTPGKRAREVEDGFFDNIEVTK